MTQTDYEPDLGFVTLADDGYTLLLNDDQRYSLRLPMGLSRKKAAENQKIIESTILNACNSYGVDYVSMDNIRRRAKEIVDLLYERARVTKNYVPPPLHPTILEKYGNNYFEFLIDCVKSTVKEENSLIRQIMYTKLSAYGNDPINLGVLAPTSTGKTYPITESAKYTPLGKEVRIVGSMSPKVLIREQGVLVDKQGNLISKEVRRLKNAIAEAKSKKKFQAVEENQDELAALLDGSAYILDMSNKTQLFLEPPHLELWALIKPILSHDAWEMEHPFVDKLANGMEVKRVITRGWPACIFCSAKDESKWDMWPEIESRFMIVSPNMVKPKYQAGNKLIAQKKGLPKGVKPQIIISDEDKELGKKCFLYLKHQIQQYTSTTDSPVWIPFGERLAEILPADKGQDNRAANRFFTILNMVALAKAHLRHKLIFDDEELVIATLEDLRETLHIMQNVTGMPPHKLKFYQQYILPLYQIRNAPLETKEICDFYNANISKSTIRMNSDNLRKNYLQELVNHNYLEQQQDENTKATKYLYTPLVDIEEEAEEQQQQQNKPATAPTSGPIFQDLYYSKLLLPENHKGIPQDWLKQEILQLSDRRLTKAPLKILDSKGNDIPIDDLITQYELEKGPKIQDFVKVPRLVGLSNSVKNIALEGSKAGGNGKNTTNNNQEDEKWKTHPKVGGVGRTEFGEIIQKAMGEKGYFTTNDFIYSLVMLPNENWTEVEAEQTLCKLLQEGKLEEIESEKFKPSTQKLSESRGT
jgi:hypothetical protein